MSNHDHQRLAGLNRLVPAESRDASFEGPRPDMDSRERHADVGPVELLVDRMSGRWKYAIPLAIVLAILCGAMGYTYADAYYISSGLVRVAPKITPLVGETIETGAIPNYQGHVHTQARLIRSARVRERALNSLPLDRLPWETRTEALEAIQHNLDAEADRRSELITVTFRAASADVAQLVLDAVLEAYDDLYASAEGEEFIQRLSQLRSNRERLHTRLRHKKGQIQELLGGGEFVVSDFNALIQRRAMRIEQLEYELRWYESQLKQYEAAGHSSGHDDIDDIAELSGEELLSIFSIDFHALEQYDRELARIGRQREEAQIRFNQAQNRYRPEHRVYSAAERELSSINTLYNERSAAIIHSYLSDPQNQGSPHINTSARVEAMRAEVEHLQEQAARMGMTQLKLDQLRSELLDIEEQYNTINERIRLMELESDTIRSGNISIAAMADRPSSPRHDRRRIIAAMGAVGGFGAGLGFFFLLGSVDRRTYAVTQLKQSEFGKQLLGVLPSLPRTYGDEEASGVAAHCVHQIRNQIEAVRMQSTTPAIVISSPFQGDGKTSLTLALGASYATAGYRTLLVDCDLVGRSLSRHLSMDDKAGLQESLQIGTINGNARRLNLNNLNVLPAGVDSAYGPERIRKADVEELLKDARKAYDVILIDTGPLFGSIECLPVAAAADGVVLTVRRGRRMSGLHACLQSLQSVRSTCIGIVLNHAQARDCEQYVSNSKHSTVSESSNGSAGTSKSEVVHRNVLLEAVTTSAYKHDS